MNAIQIETVITRVEVYRSLALVTRKGPITARPDAGRSLLNIDGLPLSLDDSSVRVHVEGARDAQIDDVQVNLVLPPTQSRQSEAKENLFNLLRQRREIWRSLGRLEDHLGLIGNIRPARICEGDLPDRLAYAKRSPVQPGLAAAAYVREESITLMERRRDLKRQLRNLDDLIAHARNELAAESSAAHAAVAALRKGVRVRLDLARRLETDAWLTVTYLVPNATWCPQYEVRVEEQTGHAELLLIAVVAQRSGEDWGRCELALSTADLQRSVTLPEVQSWRIGRAHPPRPSGWRPLPETSLDLYHHFDEEVANRPQPSGPQPLRLPPPLDLGDTSPTQQQESRAAPERVDVLVSRLLAPQWSAKGAEQGATHGQSCHYPSKPQARPVGRVSPVQPSTRPCISKKSLNAHDLAEPPLPAMAAAPMAMPRQKMAHYGAVNKSVARPEENVDFPCFELMDSCEEESADWCPEGRPGWQEDEEMVEGGRLMAGDDALAYERLRMVGPDEGSASGQLKALKPVDQIKEQLAAAQGGTGASPLGSSEAATALVKTAMVAADRHLKQVGFDLPAHGVPVNCSAGHFAVRYEAEGSTEILADGQFHSLAVFCRSGPTNLIYRTVPLESPNVYAVAVLNNPFSVPLLAGPVRVFRGGDFVTDTSLPTMPPGKPLEVNLGVEPALAVARNTHFRETTEGVFGGKNQLTHTVEIELRSKVNRPVTIEVFERVPVSADQDVVVEILKSSPESEPYDQAEREATVQGGRRFTVTMEPGQVTTCTLIYRITISSKQMLMGGNRRD